MATAAAQVEALANVIRRIPITPGAQKKIDALYILRAVRGTTGIEGIERTEEEVGNIIESPDERTLPPSKEREEQEARNAAKVMAFVAETIQRDPQTPLT